jgi:hypothetical protein
MKLLKYFAALLLIFSMNVCLISCGDDDDEPTPAVDPKDYPQHEFFYVDGIGYKSISGADVEVTRLNSLTTTDEYTGDVVIPNTVTYQGYTYNVVSIGERAFKGCTRINSVTMPESVTKIGKNAFQETSLQSITIGANVREICEEAFIYNVVLKTVVISDKVEKIGKRAFAHSVVENITLGKGVKEIGYEAFKGCDRLTSMTIPDKVVSIGDFAFYGCSALRSVAIGESIRAISFRSFAACRSLQFVICKSLVVPVTASTAFDDTPDDKTLRVPGIVLDYYKEQVPWKIFKYFGPILE